MTRSSITTALALLAFVAPVAFGQVDIGALGQATQKRTPVQQPTLKQAGPPAVRSAQSDCVREANRRGFAVIDTANFQQSRDGWSIDLRVRDSRGRVQQGTCFVETRTGDVALHGFGWGWNDEGDDRFEFNCSSVEDKYRECQLPINGRARLIKRRSDSPCIEGRSWGQRGDRVWVDDGCRARFEVVRSGGGGSGGSSSTIDCLSEDGRYRECSIGPGRFGRLVREYSNGRCREDRSWGTRNGAIWVTDGCRARFEVRRGQGNGQDGGNVVSADQVRRACVAEVQRYGHTVEKVGTPSVSGNDYRVALRIRARTGEQRNVDCRVSQSSGKVRLD
jgi:hypothetical protein